MSFFEYISVAFSIVLSLSAAQLLGTVRSVFAPAVRYWVHGLWVAHLLILHVITWWSGWAFREVSWNLGSFALALSGPASLYVAASVLSVRDPSVSLRQHFLAHRTQFFVARGLVVLSAMTLSYFLLGTPLVVASRLIGLLLLAICVAGIASANPRLHGVLAVVGLVTEILVVGYLRLQPGWWAGPQP